MKKSGFLAFFLGSATLLASSASAGPLPTGHNYTVLGGLDLNLHCQNTHGASSFVYLFGQNSRRGATAYDWQCIRTLENGDLYSEDIDINQACKQQYNEPSAYSGYRNFRDPYSWVCVR